MTNHLREQWSKLYCFTRLCSEMQPWDRFSEAFPFVYVQKGTGKEIVFSILGSEYPFCGFAVYNSWYEFSMAQHRMRGTNKKHEPLFLLQNAMIGIFGARADVSKENYAVMKELDQRGHGDGSWLHFEKYRIGYMPSALSESEVSELADSMGNLYMMLKAICEHAPNEIKPGTAVLRTYNIKKKQFDTSVVPLVPLAEPNHPVIAVEENENLLALAAAPTAQYTLELDWSYAPTPIKENGVCYIPRMLIGADGNGYALISHLLPAGKDQYSMVFNALAKAIEAHGRPKEIKLCDRELEGILADFCRRIGVSLRMVKNLPQVNRFRNGFLNSIKETE
ncbi:MAG: hypothetical protein IJK54_06945 [Clostridia bacterium]|nr:hypothetical protein [Clostridia bacterium]